MHASFTVSTPEGGGDFKYINRRNVILYKKYIHKSPPDDLENIPIQIYHYVYTMSPTSLHLQQMSTATILLLQMKFTHTIKQIILNLRHDNFNFKHNIHSQTG
jgi:hypothetical protein